MQIVTSGSQFLDIDAYGGCAAYAELLQKLGQNAKAVSTAPFNESITPEIRSWQTDFTNQYNALDEDNFTLIDISEPSFFDTFVKLDRVTEVIDHHPGSEDIWTKLGDKSTIEFIGAACTLVYEKWQVANKLPEISMTSARLLVAGILDNTLNFKAGVTTDRDRQAFEVLMTYAQLPENWPTKYFNDCQKSIEQDIQTALRNDTKTMLDVTHLPTAFGQIVIWDAQELLANRLSQITSTMMAINEDWAVNVISIAEGKSYFIAKDPGTKAKFGKLMSVDLSSGVVGSDRLWLRKEILKRAQDRAAS